MSTIAWLWVLPGCALGGLLRFWVTGYFAKRTRGPWPTGTLAVNLSGSFLLGILLAVVNAEKLLNVTAHSHWVMALGAGFLGAYTTYSSFALQVHTLHASRQTRAASAYIFCTLAGGLGALAIGYLGVTLWL